MSENYPEAEELNMVPPSSDILNRSVQPVLESEIETDDIQAIIDGMLDVARGEQGNPQRPTMVGLAAPQLGIDKRIVVIGIDAVGMGEEPEFKAFINPEIVSLSPETNLFREGCYSTSRVCGIVERADRAEVRAFDRNGNAVLETFTGFQARILQHEVDHLDGIRFPDRITDDERLFWVEESDFGDFREHWQDWPHTVSRADWEAIKTGKPPIK